MPEHFMHLKGANTLLTADYELAADVVGDVADQQGLGLVYGKAGVGKTFAVDAALENLDVLSYRIDFPVRITPKQLTASLLKTLSGVVSPAATHAELHDELIDVLSQVEVLIKIDEAQRLDYPCVETLRNLWDQPSSNFGLLLVGGHGCWETIRRYPMLRSRISGCARFRPLEPHEVPELIPQFHPIYREADLALITRVDRRFAHGNLRNWTNFTNTAAALLDRSGQTVLDDQIVDFALVKLPPADG